MIFLNELGKLQAVWACFHPYLVPDPCAVCIAIYPGIWLKDVVQQQILILCPDSKVHGANMGPIWGRQDPGGPHVGPINFAIWVGFYQSIN